MAAALTKLHIEKVDFLARYKERGYSDPHVMDLLAQASGIHTVSFELRNVDPSIANGIRRCVLGETPTRVMTFDLCDVETNSPFILTHLKDIQNRFRLIPISQNVPMETTTSYSASNNTDNEYVPIYTNKIENNTICDKNYKISTLNAHEYFRIKKIYISEGRGLDHGCYKAPVGFTYVPLDYISVDYVLANVVASVIVKKTPAMVGRVIINPGGKSDIPSGYDTVITDEVPHYTTNLAEPRDYALGFKFDNRVDGRAHIIKSINYLIERLKAASETTFISIEGESTLVNLPMETATIGLIITRGIMDIKPDIKYVCSHTRHLTEPNIEIRIVDLNAMLLYKEAIKKRISILEMFVKQLQA